VPTSWRAGVERRSAALVVYLRAMPRWQPAAVVAVVFLAGLVLPGPAGAIALLSVAGFLGWLMVLSWPALPTVGRAARGLTLVLLLLMAASKAARG